MYLAYFDENKHSDVDPDFFIGGILVSDKDIKEYESIISQIQYNYFGTNILNKDTELHGKEIFHGKVNFKNHKLQRRIELIETISNFLINKKVPIRLVCIDVKRHKEKYNYPQPEYQLGLMLILERFCDFLDKNNEIGLVFSDYEKDEIARAILDFSQFKFTGSTPMYFGRPLGRIMDTIYFTHSHHSRFLQISDIVIYLANRFDKISTEPAKWHEKECWKYWKNIKNSTDVLVQNWP